MPNSPMLRIALVQMNPLVGALGRNAALILDAAERARAGGAQVVVAPELAITGYPPEDLLLRPRFLEDTAAEIERIASRVHGFDLILGAPVATAPDPSKYTSHWPGNAGYGAGGANARPRSATVMIVKDDGGTIGS